MNKFAVVLLLLVTGITNAQANSSPEQTLCRHMSSAVNRVIDMSSLDMTTIDQVECFQQLGDEPQKFCLFRHEYQTRYMIKDSAGAEFYDALVEYFGAASAQNSEYKLQGGIVIGAKACEVK